MNADSGLSISNLVAHRGYAGRYVENTLAAITAAIAAGARYVEIDVQLTADHVPVLYHDRSLQALAHVAGAVADLSLQQMRALRLTASGADGQRFASQHPCSLQEVALLLAAHPQVTLFVELKRVSLQTFSVPLVVDRVLTELAPVREQCVIISYDRPALEYARERGVDRIGWVMEPWDDAMLAQAQTLQPQFLFTDHSIVPADARPLAPAPWQWALYEIGSLELARRWHDDGAHLLETFHIGDLIARLDDR